MSSYATKGTQIIFFNVISHFFTLFTAFSCVDSSGAAGVCTESCPSLIEKFRKNEISRKNYFSDRKEKCKGIKEDTICCADFNQEPQWLRNLKSNLPMKEECTELQNRIFGGSDAKIGEFPWSVMLNYKNGERKTFLCEHCYNLNHLFIKLEYNISEFECGGTLISSQYVLTGSFSFLY
jgi:Trypsin